MCGRYIIMDDRDISEIERIIEEINRKYNGVECKTGEIFPTNNAPVLALENNKPELTVMKWGFPKWDNKGVIINAKSETALEKKMFAKPLMQKRCVIPSTGFFEWQTDLLTKEKTKFLFNSHEEPMLYMAGFYNTYKAGEDIINHFIILTRSANKYMDIHDRMPVMLYKRELALWLKDDKFIDETFKRDDVILHKTPA